MSKKSWIKFKLLFRQNWIAFSIILSWFLINYLVFVMLFMIGFQGTTQNAFVDAVLVLFYFTDLNMPYGHFYPVFSEFIIFGLIFSLITVELYRISIDE